MPRGCGRLSGMNCDAENTASDYVLRNAELSLGNAYRE